MNEHLLRALLQEKNITALLLDRSYRITAAQTSGSRWDDYFDKHVNDSIFDLAPDLAPHKSQLENIFAGGLDKHRLTVVLHLHRATRLAAAATLLPFNTNGAGATNLLLLLEPVDDKNQTSLALPNFSPQAEHRALLALLDNAPVGFFIKDNLCRYVWANKKMAELYGAPDAAAIIGHTDKSFMPDKVAQQLYEQDQKILRDGLPAVEQKIQLVRPHAEDKWLTIARFPLVATNGGITAISGSARDITELVSAGLQVAAENEERRKAQKAARMARQASTNFLASISHEIRTPMNGIIGMTNLLLSTKQTREQLEFTEIIRTSGESLLRVINDILDYSKMEAGHFAIDNETFNVRHFIEECLDIHSGRAAQKGIELAYSIQYPCPEEIRCDKSKLLQILTNLIGNSVKFTETGNIVVSIKCEKVAAKNYKLHVQVRDTGIGIPKDKCKKIFNAFEQAHDTQSRAAGGTGLGLTITKRIVELLGGSISVKSEVGKGSTFSITLNVEVPQPESLSDNKQDDHIFNGKKVLVVDDNEINRRILNEQLRVWGFLPTDARDGYQALDILRRSGAPDIAIFDMHMPGLDALALTEKVRDLAELHDLPIIILSSVGLQMNKTELSKYKIEHFLTKPVKQSRLHDTLISILTEKQPDSPPYVPGVELDAQMASKWPLKILVAEDNRVNQMLVQQILSKLGYQPVIVEDGQLAVEQVEKEQFDLVLMDVQMPRMDGVEASRQITSRFTANLRPQIIALTAHAMPGDREKFLQAGMDYYLSKPLKIGELITALKNCERRVLPAKPVAASEPNPTPEKSAGNGNGGITMDLEAIKHAAGFDDSIDDSLIIEIIQEYIKESDELVETMLAALQNMDFDVIYRVAHTLKSSSEIVGALQYSQLAAELCVAAKEREKSKTLALATKMAGGKTDLLASLRTLCQTSQN